MKRWMRKGLIGLFTTVALVALVAAAAVARGAHRLEHAPQPVVGTLPEAVGAAALARGAYLFGTLGCAGCHGDDGAGKPLWNGGRSHVDAPHIAPGPGSVTAAYRPEDWVRALRHGIGGRGQALFGMPSVDFQHLADADLAALVAHIRRMPPVSTRAGGRDFGPLMQALIGLGIVPLAPDRLRQGIEPVSAVVPAATAEHGRYVAQMCVGCHRPGFEGGPIAGMPPGTPAAADLRPLTGSAMSRYSSLAEFQALLRSGQRPDGQAVKVMPFESLKRLDATDTAALFMYLKGLPVPKGAAG